MNLAGAGALPLAPETRPWFRAIQARYWPSALGVAQSNLIPTRFNQGPSAGSLFKILYLAENHQAALFEAQALLGSPLPPGLVVPNPHGAWTVLNVTVQLQAIADLTNPVSQALIGSNAQELTGDWRGYHHRGIIPGSIPAPTGAAPTQQLGAALFALPGLEGFVSFSARVPTHKILVVFRQRLGANSFVEFSDPGLGTH